MRCYEAQVVHASAHIELTKTVAPGCDTEGTM